MITFYQGIVYPSVGSETVYLLPKFSGLQNHISQKLFSGINCYKHLLPPPQIHFSEPSAYYWGSIWLRLLLKLLWMNFWLSDENFARRLWPTIGSQSHNYDIGVPKKYIWSGAIHKVRAPFSKPPATPVLINTLSPYPHPTPVKEYSCNTFSKYNECKKKSKNMKQPNP